MNESPPERFLKKLALADPESAEMLTEDVHSNATEIPKESWEDIWDEAIWSLSIEVSFAREYVRGLLTLTGRVPEIQHQRYRNVIHEAAAQGPTLGRIYATHLSTVVRWCDGRLLEDVMRTISVMLGKGSYTLNSPLRTLSTFLEKGETTAIPVYLDLLKTAFSLDLTYNQSQHMSATLPKAVDTFTPKHRIWQTWKLEKVISEDVRLVDPFLEGMENGLRILSKRALDRFVDEGIELYGKKKERGIQFLSLNSREGRNACAALQVTVSLAKVRPQINKYLRARTGLSLTVAPVSSLPGSIKRELPNSDMVLSDNRCIYLPGEIGRFPQKWQNVQMFMLLAKLEAGFHEFGTFEFDFDKAADQCRLLAPIQKLPPSDGLSDMDRFFRLFPSPVLAKRLFIICEHGRQYRLLSARYPGMMRRALPFLLREMESEETGSGNVLASLYRQIVLPTSSTARGEPDGPMRILTRQWVSRLEENLREDSLVESCAVWTFATYPEISAIMEKSDNSVESWKLPFNRGLLTGSRAPGNPKIEEIVTRIKDIVEAKGYRIYRSDLRKRIQERDYRITSKDIQELVNDPPGNSDGSASNGQSRPPVTDGLDLPMLLGTVDSTQLYPDSGEGQVTLYREWNDTIGDYLQDHTRVRDRRIGDTDNRFYEKILKRRKTLVKGIRQVFELLKPEGMKILRQWTEGDAFDYRALLDYVMDRRAGQMPSDRLYIKRLKAERDIAVLILVDMSRSTANPVAGISATVLDVEKEALVLFCEALDVLGDSFAIAGFSGTGRLGVDYYRIKDFDDLLDDASRRKIGAMASQRSTRMGAAIRHATAQLERVPSRVRLLMILGDGFPNDLDYKQNYAIADTRKAVFEARSLNIHVKAMTVNIAADPKLDDLYGNHHHNVISDVRELPDKLLRVYSALTR